MRTHGRLRFWMLVSKLSKTWFSKSVLMKATDPATEMLTFTRNFFRLVKSLKPSHLQYTVYETGSQAGNLRSRPGEKHS